MVGALLARTPRRAPPRPFADLSPRFFRSPFVAGIMPDETRPAPRRIDLLTLFVDDLEKMVSFYRDSMGMETPWNGDEPYAEFRHTGVRFALFPRRSLSEMMGVDASYPLGINGTFSLSIMFDDPTLVDAEYERLNDLRISSVYAPRDEPWGLRSAMVHDPEGNLVELAAWLPEAG